MSHIPKVIHYVWVGRGEMPEIAQRCLESWREKLPDFEIKIWNEDNSPMTVPFVRTMYEKKLWAFVSDYIRFWALYNEGGVYLDTDSLVLKYFDNTLMDDANFDAFFGYMQDNHIGCGAIGAVKGQVFIKNILDYYEKTEKSTTQNETSPSIVTKLYKELSPSRVKIFDTKYLNPCVDEEIRTKENTKYAYIDNLYGESWVKYRRIRKFLRRTGIMKVLKKVLKR